MSKGEQAITPLERLYSGIMSDVTLQIQIEKDEVIEYKSHKILLASKSRYFAVLFTENKRDPDEGKTASYKLPALIAPEVYDLIHPYFYGFDIALPRADLLSKMLQTLEFLGVPLDAEIGLVLSLAKGTHERKSEDLLQVYGQMKNLAETMELEKSKSALGAACKEVLRTTEETLCTRIKEIIQAEGMLDILPPALSLSLIETSLIFVGDNHTLKTVLYEIMKRVKAPSLFVLLDRVFNSCLMRLDQRQIH